MRDRWGLVVASSLMIFVAQLDVTVVNVALPTIQDVLGADATVLQWVVLGYLAPVVGLALCAGRWVDVADPRRVLVLACAGFGVASVACGLAPDIGWLVTARVTQGVFAVLLLAISPVLTTVAVAPARRARAFGVAMLFGTAGGMTGPVIGGRLVETVGWPWIFYLNVPVLALVVVLASRSLPLGDRLPRPARSWLVEAATVGGAAVAVLVGLSLGVAFGPVWAVVAVAAVPLFLAWFRSAAAVPVRELLRARGVGAPHVALVAVYTGLFLVTFVLPFFLQDGLGVTPGIAGLALLAFPVGALATSFGAGLVADRLGTRRVALCGVAVIGAGLTLLAFADDGWAPWDLAWRVAVVGAGFGLFNGQLQVLLMGNAPRERLGLAAATSNLVRQLGVAFGSASGAALLAVSGAGGAPAPAAVVALALLVVCGAAVAATRTTSAGALASAR